MYLSVRDYNAAGGAVINSIPNMAGYQTILVGNIVQIQTIRQQQELDKTGIAVNKGELRVDLINKAVDVAKKVEAYAVFVNNYQLKNEVHYVPSDLKSSADTILRDKCQVINDKATANLSNLSTYGVSAAILSAFQTAITAFNASIPKPRLGQVDKKDATAQLKVLFENTDKILSKMDAMIEVIRTSNLNFYNGFKSARIIIESGTGSIALKGMAVDATSGEHLKNVEFVFTPENPENFKLLHKGINLTKKTAVKGSFYFKFLPAGTYTVTVSKKGFVSQTHTVNVINGEMAVFMVEMVNEISKHTGVEGG